MTYNEMKNLYSEYVIYKIKDRIRQFSTTREMCKHFNVDEGRMSRICSGQLNASDKILKILFNDESLADVDELEMKDYLKNSEIRNSEIRNLESQIYNLTEKLNKLKNSD